MAYADYAFYKNTYSGNAVPSERWGSIALRADAHIDAVTFCRLRQGAAITDSVRMACCAVSDVVYAQAEAATALALGIKSESTDGYSVSYEDAIALNAANRRQLSDAIDLFLPPCDALRYAGVSHARRCAP